MNVSIVGSGYVGTTVAACLADLGHEVTTVDIDEDIVDAINAGLASSDLNNIKVVPNPYFVQYSPLVERNEGLSVLEFQNVPDRCTIRIYTLAGDLVETLENVDGTGTVRWDLLSTGRQQVASGMYIYHLESPYGEHMGRFAVIK